MFTKTKDNTNPLDDAIINLLSAMANHNGNTEEYTAMAKNLETLYKAKSLEKDRRVSPEALLAFTGNILGIGMIIGHEKVGVVTSKALGFVMKSKL